jgi:aspartokinase
LQKIRLSGQKLSKGDLLTITEGFYEIVIFTSQKYRKQIRKLLGKLKPSSELSNLAIVTVNWPASTKNIPGIYYRITRALAIRQIAIQSFHTIGSEMMIIVSEESFGRAHETIYSLLYNDFAR